MESTLSSERTLVRIIRCVLTNEYTAFDIPESEWNGIADAAKKHGLIIYVYQYLDHFGGKVKVDPDVYTVLKQNYYSAVKQSILQENAVAQMKDTFEAMGVDHMFFKGTVTRTRYQNELLRSMGDIDVLYDPEQEKDLQNAMKRLLFRCDSRGRVHDIYKGEQGIVVEAHRELLPPGSPYALFSDELCRRVHKVHGVSHCYEMNLEDEIIFNIIHLASHFKKGGAGIRFIVDIWVYHRLEANMEYIISELKSLGLEEFYNNTVKLAERWFGDETEDTITMLSMEEYILNAGIFGTKKNRNDSVIATGRMSYLRRIMFPSFKDMRSMFPWLRHRVFLPLAWLIRGVESLVKRKKNVRILFRAFLSGDMHNAKALAAFYESCGLTEGK